MKEEISVLIYGTGGLSKEVYYCIKQINEANCERFFNVLGFVEDKKEKIGEKIFDNQKIIASDDTIENFIKDYEKIGCIIPIGDPHIKIKIYERIKTFSNIFFPNIIHPSVLFDSKITKLGQGNIISAGVILSCGLKIGDFNLVNITCTVGHDVIIGNFNTINPLTAISGNVTIGNGCLIGAGSTVLQQLIIEDNVTIGAGAVLTKDAKAGEVLVGIPARSIKDK
ncbi:NeuD/PglB/VioB family sugar acetyltransferase [Anaerovorax odorimutans]|uniref:NeuD/PglB/VioB family sugar acetyltransferase n=1 Tax=Anaerovorax odorimutans TaxID=109327 RepID=UPI0004168E17|nr:NeuD/PglB/VioB family sugar acetyltransferase [Anaerovorax odorimutans]